MYYSLIFVCVGCVFNTFIIEIRNHLFKRALQNDLNHFVYSSRSPQRNQIVETDRTFTYDAAGKLLTATETEDNYGTCVYTFEYDLMGNRTYMEKTLNGTVVEWHRYEYNESNQLISEKLYNGKKTTSLAYTYDADGNRISETGRIGTDKVNRTYEYSVENRLAAVHDGDELLLAAAYDGDGNRVFLLNYNLHTDDDWKGNSGNGNGNNKDNSGSGNNGKGNSGNNGNGNGNGKGKGNNKKNSKSGGTDDAGYGNATNAEENNSQNQCGILFPVQEEVSATEADLIARIKTTGKEKNYELIEYLNDVNREHAEVLVEQNINGRTDTSYIYGAEINGGFDRISLDRFDGSTGYYLYDARGSVSGITNEEGQVYQSYRYSVTGEITFGAPQYENEYTYNGESYNPNIQSQYLRTRYYCVVTATFLTEDSYLGNQTEPLTFNRYNYCVSSYLNYTDPSGNEVEVLESLKGWIIDPDTQAQKTIENYENQRLSIEDAIESGLLNNRAGQIFLDYGDIVMGPAVKTPADIIVIRETVKGNSDSKEMQRTATAGFYAGFVGQGIEYTQIISNADYQLSMIITSAKGVNSINNPLSYLLFIKDFSLTQTLDAAKAGLQDAWNGIYDSAIGRKIGAGTFNYLLMTIGGAQLKGKGTACEAVESGSKGGTDVRNRQGRPVLATEKTLDMALNPETYANTIAEKYGINLRGSGQSITIKYNADLRPGIYGRTTAANPYVIEIGSDALVSEEELANTIAHELNHARDFIRGGIAPESSAYSSGNALSDYIMGGR